MSKFKKFFAIMLGLALALTMASCGDVEKPGDDGDTPGGGDENPTVVTDVSEVDFTESMHTDIVNYYGRYYHDTSAGKVLLNNTASGFEVRFTGTKLEVKVRSVLATSVGWDITGNTYVGVSTDGGEFERTQIPQVETRNVTLVKNLAEGEHTVKVLKATEAKAYSFEIFSVKTDGKFMSPPAKPSMIIDVYGDSITSGHSTLKEPGGKDSSSTNIEDGLLSYGFRAAMSIGATANVFSVSGAAVSDLDASGAGNTIPSMYKRTDPAANGSRLWDFAANPVNAVIIDLGTNDIIRGKNEGFDFPTTIERDYKAFVRELRSEAVYGDIPVLICYGTYSDSHNVQEYNSLFAEIASDLDTELGKVYGVQLDKCGKGHPSGAEDAEYAVKVAGVLRTALGLAA